MDLEKLLRQAIEMDGRDLTELAKASGVNYGALHRFKHGKRTNITIHTVSRLLKALGYEVRPVAGTWPRKSAQPARRARPSRKAKKRGG